MRLRLKVKLTDRDIEKTIEQVNCLLKFYGLKIGWKKNRGYYKYDINLYKVDMDMHISTLREALTKREVYEILMVIDALFWKMEQLQAKRFIFRY